MRFIQQRHPPFDLVPENEYYEEPTEKGPLVVGDIPDHVSPVTGEVIHGRASMRRHMKEHGLAHADDFKEHWKTKAKEREAFFNGTSQQHRKEIRRDMVEALKRLGG